MHLKLFRHLWGVEMPWEESFPKIRALNYAGIEAVLPDAKDESRFVDLLKQFDLLFIATVHTRGNSVAEHLKNLEQKAICAKQLKALFVAAQAGSDSFNETETNAFYSTALKIESATGIAIAHETHRGRPSFNPWATACILEKFPTLKVVSDLSHWVCVCERLLEDCGPIIELTAAHTHHIHARVGYSQGPQVPDPREPQYQAAVEAHERWWNLMWKSQKARGFTETTMCPEFGPPPYLQTAPVTGSPTADLWDIVGWQSDRQRQRFSEFDRSQRRA